MPALARVGRTYVGVDRSAMLGVGMAWTEAERAWELQAEGPVDDHGESFGVASSERVFDFETEKWKVSQHPTIQEDTYSFFSLRDLVELPLESGYFLPCVFNLDSRLLQFESERFLSLACSLFSRS